MARDREAMSFVANLLHEMQARVIGAQNERLRMPRYEELLETWFSLHAFCDTGKGHVH